MRINPALPELRPLPFSPQRPLPRADLKGSPDISLFDRAPVSKAKVQLGAVAPEEPTSGFVEKTLSFDASTMFLLTDGKVMAQDAGPTGDGTKDWYVLTPDQ